MKTLESWIAVVVTEIDAVFSCKFTTIRSEGK